MKRILAIAINDYEDTTIGNLKNCVTDINSIISILSTKYDFDDVEFLSGREQTTREFLHAYLHDYFVNALPEDQVLLLFAGHGEYDDKLSSSYWLPSDAKYSQKHTWLNLNELIDLLRATEAFHVNIISDSCFSGAIFETASRGGGAIAFESKMSRLALTSGSIEKVSDGPTGGKSPFAEVLSEVLANNTISELPFTVLSSKVILAYMPVGQTPMFGSLAGVGHKGGAMVFKLKDIEAEDINWSDFTELSIALNINLPIKIKYDCSIPLFKENKVFDHIFVNSYVHQMAYEVIGEARNFFTNLPPYLLSGTNMQFDLSIGFKIHTINKNFFSMTLSTDSYFGGAHPNNSISSLNIAFGPERKIDLGDIIEYSGSFENFITSMIQSHCDSLEQKELLIEYVSDITSDIDFSISEDTLTIYFNDYIPRVHMPHGFLEIPLNELDLKFNIQIM